MQVKVTNLRSNEFESELIQSVKQTGFVVLTHHGIDPSFIKDTQMAWREFFLNTPEYKNAFVNSQDPNMGYKGFKQEKALGAKNADLKEFFHWKPGQKMPFELWAMTQHMFYQLNDVGQRILTALDRDIGAKRGQLTEACWNSDNTLLRSLYYPAMDYSKDPDAIRAAAHEDIDYITLLVAASAPGLQVKDSRGEWYDVPSEENSIVVNIGDMLQLATNGRYKSTTHRVINPDSSRSDRLSMPLFIHPHSDTLLATGITAAQFLDKRLKEIYLDSQK